MQAFLYKPELSKFLQYHVQERAYVEAVKLNRDFVTSLS